MNWIKFKFFDEIGTRSLSAPPAGGGGSPFIPARGRQAHEERMNWIKFKFFDEIGTRSLSAPPAGGGGSPFIPACGRQARD